MRDNEADNFLTTRYTVALSGLNSPVLNQHLFFYSIRFTLIEFLRILNIPLDEFLKNSIHTPALIQKENQLCYFL